MITYTEFETTPALVQARLKAEILANSHWSDLGITSSTTTTSGATTSSGTTVTVTNIAGFAVGQVVLIGASNVEKVISAIAGNVITITTTWGAIYASGSSFKNRGQALQSTTTSGAKLILNLEGDISSVNNLGMSTHTNWVGTGPDGFVDRETAFLYWKASAGTTTMPIHVTLSVGQDHLFIGIEGPRSHEVGAQSTTYGSVKNYFAMSDLVRYHAADTVPTSVSIGQNRNLSATPSTGQNNHQVGISRDSLNTNSWGAGRLASLDFPTVYSTDVITMNRSCTIDGKNYLLPYVLFSESEGIRGRLARFFYANTNTPSPATDYPDPVGVRVEYEGIVYRLLAVNKGDGTTAAWGPFGSAANTSSTPLRSVIVAVPYAEAA